MVPHSKKIGKNVPSKGGKVLMSGYKWASVMCGGIVMGWSIFEKSSMVLQEILGMCAPLNPGVMLLLDFVYFKISRHKDLVANMLTAATLLVAKK